MLWFKKSAKSRSAKDDPNTSLLRRFAGFERRGTSYSQAIEAEKAMHHMVTLRCLDKLGTTMQGVNWYVERDPNVPKSFRTNSGDVSRYEAMLRSPNNDFDGANLRYWMAISWAAFGRIPLKIGVNLDGETNAIYPLYPGITSTKRSKSTGEIYAFKYGNSSDAVEIPSRHKARRGANDRITESFAFEIKKPTLRGMNDCESNTPLNAVGLPADIILQLMQRAHDTASGHPNSKYVIATEKNLTVPQQKDLEAQFNDRALSGGGEESGNVLILGNTKIQVEKLDNDLSDIHSKMPLDDMSRHITGLFGIPVALIGFAGSDGSKFANNYTESRRAFFEDTIVPGYCTPFAASFSENVLPEGYVLKFDLDSINAIQDFRVSRAKELTPVSFLTNDEKRELCGYPPLKDGQVLPIVSTAGNASSTQSGKPDPAA